MMDAPALTAAIAETQLGFVGVVLSDAGIRYATLFHRTRAACLGELRAAGAAERPDPRGAEIARLLTEYAGGSGDALERYPVDLPPAPPIRRAVWLALRDIPCGQTRSYAWVSRRAGAGDAYRAVGAAVGANPIPLWLPCHRVVGSDGSLTGFGGGLAMKRTLLELEGALSRSLFAAPEQV